MSSLYDRCLFIPFITTEWRWSSAVFIPHIETCGKFVYITLKVLVAPLMINAVISALERRPETLYSVCMDLSAFILARAVIYPFMFELF